MKKLSILGIRGIPAQHGGFETFAEKLALFLVNKGWSITVYCQDHNVIEIENEVWNGVNLIKIPSKNKSALDTIIFDYKAMKLAEKKSGVFLTLGYNTAIFCALLKLKNKINIINMDGMEWKRRKYNIIEKLWLYLNERLGVVFSSHIIADNPAIEKRMKKISLNQRSITMIPYGADQPKNNINKDEKVKIFKSFGINSYKYALIVARPVEENNIFEIVQVFSKKSRNIKLVVLGNYSNKIPYQKKVLNEAGDDVIFLGAIYDKKILDLLRLNARFYIHGHSVGGTNPALVEAMAARLPVLAHDNPYNRWVAGDDAKYFSNKLALEKNIGLLVSDNKTIKKMSLSSYKRYNEKFNWKLILDKYEKVFHSF